MPRPVSDTSTTARPSPSVRVRMRISCSAAAPSGMAWAAFSRRFRNTWPSRDSFAFTVGTGWMSRSTRARCRISLPAIFSAKASTFRTSTSADTSSESTRLKALRSRTMRPIRSTPWRVSVTSWRTSSVAGPSALRNRSSSSAR